MEKVIERLSDAQNPVKLIWVSIGCAAQLEQKKIDRIENADMHQKPQFILDFQRQYNVHVLTILIDRDMEDVPVCISQNVFGVPYERDGDVFKSVSETIVNIKQNCAYGECDKYSDFDIIPLLSQLSEYAVNSNSLLFLHDFSGRRIPSEIVPQEYCSLIQYGISASCELDCYIDLTQTHNMPLIEFNGNYFSIFNPRSIPNHQLRFAHDSTRSERKKQLIAAHAIGLLNRTVRCMDIFRTLLVVVRGEGRFKDKIEKLGPRFEYHDREYGDSTCDALNKCTDDTSLMLLVAAVEKEIFLPNLRTVLAICGTTEWYNNIADRIYTDNIYDIYKEINNFKKEVIDFMEKRLDYVKYDP